MDPSVVVLGGGLGTARLGLGLRSLGLLDSSMLVVNVADDVEVLGLRVCPDLDSVLYALADRFDQVRGWGLREETFTVMQELERFGHPQWFGLGDRDLATHLWRTDRLRRGGLLSTVTAELCDAHGLPRCVTPVTDADVRTRVQLQDGPEVDFQDFHVRLGSRPAASAVRWVGLGEAEPAPGVADLLRGAGLVVLAPSSPVASVLPQLGIGGVRDALLGRQGPTVAVSPIVDAVAPDQTSTHRHRTRERLLVAIGVEPRPHAIARLYADLVDAFVLDVADLDRERSEVPRGMDVLAARTITPDPASAADLLRGILEWAA